LRTITCLAVILAAAGLASPAAAQRRGEQPVAPPEVFTRLTACRDIADPGQRLACFDREVAALAQAQAAREIVVVDRAQVQETRRSLFGLEIPEVGRLFGEGREDAIEAAITHVAFDQLGRATFQLDSGAVWRQTESRSLRHPPRPGARVRIRRGSLGSYLANVDGQPAIRVLRQR
jgi:hypothetical protein